MAYTPPTYGESGEVYTDNVRNSLEHVRTAAEAAQAAADGNNASVVAASQTADQALEVAEAAKAFVESPTDSRVATLVQDPTSSTGAALSATFASLAPQATGVAATDTASLQAAIDAAAAVGGGTVRIPPGHYALALEGTRALQMKDGVRLVGSGWATHLDLTSGTISSGSSYHVIQLGDLSTGVSNVEVSMCRITANHSTLGTPAGGYVQGIGARHTTDPLAYCENVVIRGNWIFDTNLAVTASKNSGTAAGDANRLAAQHSNWQVVGNYIETCTNKAIEYQEASDSVIDLNRIVDAEDGPQAILYCRRVKITRNTIDYNGTGVNVTEASDDIDVEGNTLTCRSETQGWGGLIVRREPYATTTTMSRVRIRGNTVVDEVSTSRIAFQLQSRTENTGGTFEDVTLDGNVFVGKVYLYDAGFPADTTGSGLRIEGNTFRGDVYTSSVWASPGTLVKNNLFTTAHTANTSDWTYRDNTFDAAFTIAAARVGVDYGAAVRTRGSGYYLPPGPAAGVQVGTLTVDRIIYVPLVLDVPTAIDRLGIEVTTPGAAGAAVRLGVYRDNGGVPNTLIAEATATIDTSQPAGFYQATISAALPAGVVWLAFKTEGTTSTVRSHSGRLRPVQWNAGAGFAANLYNGYLQTGVSAGALPATAGPSSVVSNAPVVLARAV